MSSYFSLQNERAIDNLAKYIKINYKNSYIKFINNSTIYAKCPCNLERVKSLLKEGNYYINTLQEISEDQFNSDDFGFDIIEKTELESREVMKYFQISADYLFEENLDRFQDSPLYSRKFSELTRSRFFSENYLDQDKLTKKCFYFEFITEKTFFIKFVFYSLIFVLLVQFIEVFISRCKLKIK